MNNSYGPASPGIDAKNSTNNPLDNGEVFTGGWAERTREIQIRKLIKAVDSIAAHFPVFIPGRIIYIPLWFLFWCCCCEIFYIVFNYFDWWYSGGQSFN